MVHSNCYKIKVREPCYLLTYPVNKYMVDLGYCVKRNFNDRHTFRIPLHTVGRSYQVVKSRVVESKLIVTMYKEQSSERKQEE